MKFPVRWCMLWFKQMNFWRLWLTFPVAPSFLTAGRRHALRLASLLAMAMLLNACSAIKVAYNQAPELTYWYLDAYADFTSVQSLQLKADLRRLLVWHRQTQLPGYVELLQDAQRQVRDDLSPSQTCAIFFAARGKLLVVKEQAETAAAQLAGALDARQLQHIERRFAKVNAEYRDDFLDARPEAIRTRRLDKAISRAEMLYGRLDEKQTAQLGRMIDQSGFDATRTYTEWQRRQRDALDTLRQLIASQTLAPSARPAVDQTLKSVNGLMERSLNSPDATYRNYAEKLINYNCKSFAEFHNTTSAAQRNHAAATLGKYEKDLKTLAGQGGS